MQPPPVDILYEEGPCLAVNKPPGVLTQAPPGIDSMEVRVKEYFKQREARSGNIYLGVPHRLDRPASGVLIFARHSRAARRISDQFERRTLRKIYWACVEGVVEPSAGTWTDTLRKVPGEPRAEVVPSEHPEGREAVLRYRTMGHTSHGSLLEIELETGRTHQVRVQAAVRGHPILGDVLYGSKIPFGPQHEDERLRAIALHARSVEFRHPMSRELVTVVAPPGKEWTEAGIGECRP